MKGEEELLDALVASFDEARSAFWIGESLVHLTAEETSLILGLKSFGLSVNFDKERSTVRSKYLSSCTYLHKDVVFQAVDTALESGDVVGVVQLLLLALFVSFLLPTTGGRLHPGLCGYVDDLDGIGKYAWGAVVYNWLNDEIPQKAKALHERNKGKSVHLGYLRGCTQVLQVWLKEHSPSAWRQLVVGGSPRFLNWEMKGRDYKPFLLLKKENMIEAALVPMPHETWLLNPTTLKPTSVPVELNAQGATSEQPAEEGPLPQTVEMLQAELLAMRAQLKSKNHMLRAKNIQINMLTEELRAKNIKINMLTEELEKWRRGELRYEEMGTHDMGEKEKEEENKEEEEEKEDEKNKGIGSQEMKVQKFRIKTMAVKSPPRGDKSKVYVIGSPVKTVKERDNRKKQKKYTPSSFDKKPSKTESKGSVCQIPVIDVQSPIKAVSIDEEAPLIVCSIPLDEDHAPPAKEWIETSRYYFGAATITDGYKDLIDKFLRVPIGSAYVWFSDDLELWRKDLWELLFGGSITDNVIHAYLKTCFHSTFMDPELQVIQYVFVPPIISPHIYRKRRDVFSRLCPGINHEMFRLATSVFMPISTEWHHWILLRINYDDHTMTFWNSMQGRSRNESTPSDVNERYALVVAKNLGALLQAEYELGSTKDFEIRFDRSCPQQPSNSLACGAYVMKYVDCIMKNEPMTFNYDDVNSSRATFCGQILFFCNRQ